MALENLYTNRYHDLKCERCGVVSKVKLKLRASYDGVNISRENGAE